MQLRLRLFAQSWTRFNGSKSPACVAERVASRTPGGVTCFVVDDLESHVFVCGSRWLLYLFRSPSGLRADPACPPVSDLREATWTTARRVVPEHRQPGEERAPLRFYLSLPEPLCCSSPNAGPVVAIGWRPELHRSMNLFTGIRLNPP
uniref:Uncharacterized protein n=1 Tax=Gasterosteus aculeatus TaxID=69293 RepID=G3P6R1_GASAC